MHLLKTLLAISLIILLSACSTEIKLAKSFQNQPNSISVLCDFPDFIYLTNAMVEVPEDLNDEEQAAFLDSLYRNSDFIRFIDDTIFFRKFKENIRKEFQGIGVNYYDAEQIDQFLSSEAVQYLVNFKQLEIEERWELFRVEEAFGTMSYEQKIWLEAVSVNAWIDVAKVNDTVEIQRPLYKEIVLTDQVDGMFFQNQWNGEVHFQYRLDTLEIRDIGNLKDIAAEEFSYYIFNYIVNKEIRDQLNYVEQINPVYHWFLQPGSKRILPENKDSFILTH